MTTLYWRFSIRNWDEVIVGCSRGGLGPLMMFGLGGTFVELIKDVQFRLAPKRDINTVVGVI
jgi:acetyltransferase